MKLIVVEEDLYPKNERPYGPTWLDDAVWDWYARYHPNDFIVIKSD